MDCEHRAAIVLALDWLQDALTDFELLGATVDEAE
jgi:hypothetical protein